MQQAAFAVAAKEAPQLTLAAPFTSASDNTSETVPRGSPRPRRFRNLSSEEQNEIAKEIVRCIQRRRPIPIPRPSRKTVAEGAVPSDAYHTNSSFDNLRDRSTYDFTPKQAAQRKPRAARCNIPTVPAPASSSSYPAQQHISPATPPQGHVHQESSRGPRHTRLTEGDAKSLLPARGRASLAECAAAPLRHLESLISSGDAFRYPEIDDPRLVLIAEHHAEDMRLECVGPYTAVPPKKREIPWKRTARLADQEGLESVGFKEKVGQITKSRRDLPHTWVPKAPDLAQSTAASVISNRISRSFLSDLQIKHLVRSGKVKLEIHARSKVPMTHQGALFFFTEESKAARKTLRYSAPLVHELACWYHELQLKEFQRMNGKPYEDNSPLPPLSKQSYLVLGLQLGAIFCPQVKEKALYAELDADWMLETGGRNVMNLICFQDAMFEFLDTWCPSVKLQDYLDLAASARSKLKEAEKPGVARRTFRKITRALLLCTTKAPHKKNKFKASVQQAMTRHYTDTVDEGEELVISSGSSTDDGNIDCQEGSLSPSPQGRSRPVSGHSDAPSKRSTKRHTKKGNKPKDRPKKAGAASLSGVSATEERGSAVRIPLEMSHNEQAALFAVEWPSSGCTSPTSGEATELPGSIHHTAQGKQASVTPGCVHEEQSAPLKVMDPRLSRTGKSGILQTERTATLPTDQSAAPRTKMPATSRTEKSSMLRTERSATLRAEKSGSLQTDKSATARRNDSPLRQVEELVPPRMEEPAMLQAEKSTLPQAQESAALQTEESVTPRAKENRMLLARVEQRAARRWVLAQRRGAVMAANAAREVLQRYESHPITQLLQSGRLSLVDSEVLAEASRILVVLREAVRAAMKAAILSNKAEATEALAEAVTAVRNAELQAAACGGEMEKLLAAHQPQISAKLNEIRECDPPPASLSTTAGAEVEMHHAKMSFPRGVRSVVHGGSEAEQRARQRHRHHGDQLCKPRPDAHHRNDSMEVSEIPLGVPADSRADLPSWALDGLDLDSRGSSSHEVKKIDFSFDSGFKSESDSSSDWEAGWDALLLNHNFKDDDDDDDDSNKNDCESDFDDSDGSDKGQQPRSTRVTAQQRLQACSQRPADGVENKSVGMTTTVPRQVGQLSSASATTSGAANEHAVPRLCNSRAQNSSRRKQSLRGLFKVDPKKSGRLEAMLQVLGQMSDENGVSGVPDACLFGGGRRRPRGKAPRVFKGSGCTSHIPQGVPDGNSGLKILVAVPEESMQAAVSMLAYLGHLKVCTAATSIELMSMLGKMPQGLYHPDVLIVDEELASMDGMNILQELENIWPHGKRHRAWVVVAGMEKDECHPRDMFLRLPFTCKALEHALYKATVNRLIN